MSTMAQSIFVSFLIIFSVASAQPMSYWSEFMKALPGSFYNEDTNWNLFELIESRGFKWQSHFVQTRDGYILQLVRILNPFVTNDPNTLPPVLLHHGFQCTGEIWLVARNGSLDSKGTYREFYYDDEQFKPDHNEVVVEDSLAFVLSTRSYDVWLANYRGSIYSTNHTDPSILNSTDFWKFSIDEQILYDLPAEIDYILKLSTSKTLSYIGHSQGNLMMFSLMSVSDHYAAKIRPFIALSPVFYNRNIKGAMHTLRPSINYLRSNPSFVPYSSSTQSILSNLCENIWTRRMCYQALRSFSGLTSENINWRRLTVFLSKVPKGSSSWNAAHLLQLYSRSDGQPASFDLGDPILNLDRYGQEKPPIYNGSLINCSYIALFYSRDDWLNPLENVERLKRDLGKKLMVDYEIPDDTYGHFDFIWSISVGTLINEKILEILFRSLKDK